jgi:RNA ligase
MTTLDELFPPADLKAEIEAGYVSRKQHPELPLSLYVYSEKCQFEPHWTAVTMRCRGLIADDETGEIIGWCLPKFFNHNQHDAGSDWAPTLPDEPFEVYDKVDGSLGIVFHYAGAWRVATKGSFVSDQAAWASRYVAKADTSALDPSVTYLAEIVYPENRIVVNYGDRRDLVLLAAFRADGTEVPLREAAPAWDGIGSVVRTYNWADSFDVLAAMAEESRHLDGTSITGTDAEGWVIRFASGLRVKAKTSDYLHLHRALTCTSERTVWEVLASGQDPAVLYDRVPDEFAVWVGEVVDRLRGMVDSYIGMAHYEFERIGRLPDRKAFAAAAMQSEHRAALFRLYDGRDIEDLAWKSCKPRSDTPFVVDEEL